MVDVAHNADPRVKRIRLAAKKEKEDKKRERMEKKHKAKWGMYRYFYCMYRKVPGISSRAYLHLFWTEW